MRSTMMVARVLNRSCTNIRNSQVCYGADRWGVVIVARAQREVLDVVLIGFEIGSIHDTDKGKDQRTLLLLGNPNASEKGEMGAKVLWTRRDCDTGTIRRRRRVYVCVYVYEVMDKA